MKEEFEEYDRQRDEYFAKVRDLLFEDKVIPQVIAAVAVRLLLFSLIEAYMESGEDLVLPMTSSFLKAYHQMKTEIEDEANRQLDEEEES